MIQKVIKVGNSLAVTLPSKFVNEAGFKAGDKINVEHDANNKILMIKVGDDTNVKLTPEFFSWLEDVGKKYREVIKELAHQ